MRLSHHTIRSGSSGRSVFVFIRSSASEGVTGLRHDAAGLAASFVRDRGEAAPVALVKGTAGAHRSGGFREIDPVLMPGVYEVGLPDAMLTVGATLAILLVRAPGAVVDPVEVALVAYDPQDPWCIGVEGLANRRRHEFLRRALPRLTEMELALGEQAERDLSVRMSGRQHAEPEPRAEQ